MGRGKALRRQRGRLRPQPRAPQNRRPRRLRQVVWSPDYAAISVKKNQHKTGAQLGRKREVSPGKLGPATFETGHLTRRYLTKVLK